MQRSKSSIGRELVWLLIWFVIFVAIMVAMNKFVVPHHFNVTIAIMISAIFAGLAMIGLRAYVTRRT